LSILKREAAKIEDPEGRDLIQGWRDIEIASWRGISRSAAGEMSREVQLILQDAGFGGAFMSATDGRTRGGER